MSFVPDAHLHAAALSPAALARAAAVGVRPAILSSATPDDWEDLRATARAQGCAWTPGLHPWWVRDATDAEIDAALDRLAGLSTPHGLGEAGLDGILRWKPSRARQLRALRAQLALARERDLPLVLHGAGAWGRLLDTIAADGLPSAGGLVHAWEGAPDLARRALGLGLHLSIGPSVFRHPRTRASLRHLPLDRLLVETDAPDRPIPGADRGEPAHVLAVLVEIHRLTGHPLRALVQATRRNTARLFPVGFGPDP